MCPLFYNLPEPEGAGTGRICSSAHKDLKKTLLEPGKGPLRPRILQPEASTLISRKSALRTSCFPGSCFKESGPGSHYR